MSMTEKIKIVLVKKKMTITQLAEALETSQSNLSKKMKRDNFSEKELEQIAEVLGIGYEANFIFEDGTKV
ncbi:helix-turn-helix domain-containing protein [Lysinibacillus boronitolerans]|uniref:helix-turn-helix domain-containing protein n=1 Tax=Lysinibacillus boronitolerans TaxID=309788 RepID=UPI0003033BFA|nr:helix-turn-helix domain-containing protein [Lysinibacillus boronitolerans]